MRPDRDLRGRLHALEPLANAAAPEQSFSVSWVKIEEPDPASDTVRVEAQSKGAARFAREEGIWAADSSGRPPRRQSAGGRRGSRQPARRVGCLHLGNLGAVRARQPPVTPTKNMEAADA